MCDACNVDRADFTRTNRRLEVVDSDDLESLAFELPRNVLFKARIRVSLRSAKAVPITVYYTARTVLVKGNRCTSWVREEFNALIDNIRAIYVLTADHHSQPNLHKELDEGLRLLSLPSLDNATRQTTNVGDSGLRPTCVTALLAKVVLSPTPSVTGGCHQPFPHWLSSLIRLPDQATLPQPSPVEDNSIPTRRTIDALIWSLQG